MEEHAFATPVGDIDSSSPPGGGGGGYRSKKPVLNSVSFDRTPAYSVKPGGEWWAKPPGALVKRWKGVGFPCIICFRLWGLTDSHPEPKGICLFTCKEAFSTNRAPDLALPAGSRSAASTGICGCPCFPSTGQFMVVPEEQGDPPSDAAVMTFIAPLPDPPPHLDHPPMADPDMRMPRRPGSRIQLTWRSIRQAGISLGNPSPSPCWPSLTLGMKTGLLSVQHCGLHRRSPTPQPVNQQQTMPRLSLLVTQLLGNAPPAI
ncbi:hypothetical protein CYMTET_18675 [Cymbomonas tetramitiformis]|uniref:Uncharacterized protein n=1 Tax=Cymbomonas tetramitiformis TaxID=36881 RepID=A0AAE0G800_9CHLO|nr:hypothetical protein CYMTET_18675 [Cymbomonas tetramitiformis]